MASSEGSRATDNADSYAPSLLRKLLVISQLEDNKEEEEEEEEEARRWVNWEDKILEETVMLVGFVRMVQICHLPSPTKTAIYHGHRQSASPRTVSVAEAVVDNRPSFEVSALIFFVFMYLLSVFLLIFPFFLWNFSFFL